jgi:prepilin-type N-terminal cleavage/methylation domain-containing protein
MESVRRRKTGFTLIELLVVVAIIALLISILLPSLKRAREQAKTVVCMANLKSIVTSSLIYTSDDRSENTLPVHPKTFAIPIDYGAYDWGGKAGIGEPTAGSDPTSSPWGTAGGRGPASRPLNNLIYKDGFTEFVNNPGPNQSNWLSDAEQDMAIYRCPSDNAYSGHHFITWRDSGLSSFDHFGNSYAANSLWCSSHSVGFEVFKSWGPFLRPISRIPSPMNTVLYIENAGRFGYHMNFSGSNQKCATSTDGPYFSISDDQKPIKGWHKNPFRFTTAFVDGHADVVKMQGHFDPAPQVPGLSPGQQASLERCHIIRGVGWQMDVLPAPAIFVPLQNIGFSSIPNNFIQ